MAIPDATTYLVTIRHLDFAVEQWGPVLAFNFGEPMKHLVHEVVQNLQVCGTSTWQSSQWVICWDLNGWCGPAAFAVLMGAFELQGFEM